MIVIIATIEVKPGKAEIFEAFMADLAASVAAREPGTHVYQLCRVPKQENRYRMIEFYADQAAIDAHVSTPWFKAALPRFEETLAAQPKLEFLDAIPAR
jgi:quinol monooxygenase YgiN